MQINSSLRRRVLATFGTFTLLLCLIYTGICVLTAYIIEDQVLENLLTDEANYIKQRYHANGEILRSRLPYIQVYSNANPAPAEVLAALPEGASRAEWFSDAERHFHLRRLSLDENTSAILAAEVSHLLTVSRQSGSLLWLIFSALLATSVLALWSAYRISSRTVRPVIALAEEIKILEKGDAPISLAAGSAGDEIGFLARTLERSLNQLRLALQRESEFTRDASHELRTGITIIRNTLTLFRQRELSQVEEKELHGVVEEMENTVSALLALARAESIEREPLELRALLEERILTRHHRIADMQFQVQLDLKGKYHSLGNNHLATLLIDNLIDNAIRHASRPELRIYEHDAALVFENPTAESFDADISFLPGKKGKQSNGLGQGLFLVKRISGALNWTCKVDCSNGLFRCAVFPRGIPT